MPQWTESIRTYDGTEEIRHSTGSYSATGNAITEVRRYLPDNETGETPYRYSWQWIELSASEYDQMLAQQEMIEEEEEEEEEQEIESDYYDEEEREEEQEIPEEEREEAERITESMRDAATNFVRHWIEAEAERLDHCIALCASEYIANSIPEYVAAMAQLNHKGRYLCDWIEIKRFILAERKKRQARQETPATAQ